MAFPLDSPTLMVQQQPYSRPWMNAPGTRMPQGYMYATYSADAEKALSAELSAEVNMRNRSAIHSNIASNYQSMPIPAPRVQYPTWSFDSNFDPLAYDPEPAMPQGQEDFYLAQSTPGSSMSMHVCSTSLPDYLQEGRSFDENFHQRVEQRSSGYLECKWQSCTYRGSFKTEASLFRHVKHMHISPRSFKCPHCDACKGRKDSLMSHIRSVHLDQVQG